MVEIPFVLEVKLVDLANPLVLEGAFFYLFQPWWINRWFLKKTIKAAVQPKDTN
jgi:hypothetical protein